MTGSQAQHCIEAARAAHASWKTLTVKQRVAVLRRLRHAIAEQTDTIIATISAEVGKPPLDILAGDIMVTLEHLRFCERHASRALQTRRTGRPALFFTGTRFDEYREPHGVALVFAPWNYPLQLSIVPMATALFAGNAVILKCSEKTPKTAALIAALCETAGLPKDLVQVLCDPPDAAAALLEARPDFVFFTGSSRNGRIVAQRAADLLIPTMLELGGKDACLVFASSHLERAVEGALYGVASNAGQVCVGVKRLYVEKTIYASFLSAFLQRAHGLRIGNDPDSDLGPIRFDSVRGLLRDQVADAIARGATLHSPPLDDDSHVKPIVLTGVPAGSHLLLEESFGPVVCIAPFHDEADAVRLANDSVFALGASVFTGDPDQARRVALNLNAGSCAINDTIRQIGNPFAAFGGNRSSGHGRYHGVAGLHAFSRIRTVMTAKNARRSEIHWFPFTPETFARMRAVLHLRHRHGSLARRIRELLRLACVFLALAGMHAFAQNPAHGSIRVDVRLPADPHGSIAYLVFTSAEGFPGDRTHALRHGFVPLSTNNDQQTIDLGPFLPGRYAITVYLDENNNHKLDRGLMGVPKEPVGASNNPHGRMGPPHFNDCAFIHGPEMQTIPIALVR